MQCGSGAVYGFGVCGIYRGMGMFFFLVLWCPSWSFGSMGKSCSGAVLFAARCSEIGKVVKGNVYSLTEREVWSWMGSGNFVCDKRALALVLRNRMRMVVMECDLERWEEIWVGGVVEDRQYVEYMLSGSLRHIHLLRRVGALCGIDVEVE